MSDDKYFMGIALEIAKKSAKKTDNVPVGAVIVDEKKNRFAIMGWNQMETKKSQFWHAEMVAIKNATKKIGDWRLDGCTLYVTLEPCMMCLGLIHLSRIARVVFAAPSPLFGVKEFYNKQYANHTCEVIGGIMEKESAALLKEFFQKKRTSV